MNSAAVVAEVGRPPLLRVRHQGVQVLDHGVEVEALELLGVVERLAHRIGQAGVAVENLNVQLVRPPVAVACARGSRLKRALAFVGHDCLLCVVCVFPPCDRDSKQRIVHQVKLTLVIAAIRYSDETVRSGSFAISMRWRVMATSDARQKPVRSRSRPCRCRSRNWRKLWAACCSSEARGRSG